MRLDGSGEEDFFAGAGGERGPAAGGGVGRERAAAAVEDSVLPVHVFGEEDVVVLPFGGTVEPEVPAVVGDENTVFGVGLCVGHLRERTECGGKRGGCGGLKKGAARKVRHDWHSKSSVSLLKERLDVTSIILVRNQRERRKNVGEQLQR
ncbi:MAG TPA: hypothetical protein VFC39_15615 [Acidobacteriaceae bacterium]|nr:hypothetical protein [Acidobacteriaceae bacterium]